MSAFDFVYQEKPLDPGITERFFECQRDGLTIRGIEYKPEGENLPVAIVSHGFLMWRDTVRDYTRLLSRLGYAAYCFDFCGGSIPGKSHSDGENWEMSPMTEAEDLEAVIRYVRSLPYTGEDLLLMGASQGGFVSALTAAKPENQVSKLVLFYPAFCIPDDARAGKMLFARFDPENIPERINCGPITLGGCYPASVIKMDPYQEIVKYEGPVLIVHGTKDAIVNVEYAKRAYEVYGADKAQLVIIEDGEHGFKGAHDKQARAVLEQFAK